MLLATALAIFLVLTRLPGSPLSPLGQPASTATALAAALLGALAATSVEAISPQGTDNLSVPLAAAAAIFLVAG